MFNDLSVAPGLQAGCTFVTCESCECDITKACALHKAHLDTFSARTSIQRMSYLTLNYHTLRQVSNACQNPSISSMFGAHALYALYALCTGLCSKVEHAYALEQSLGQGGIGQVVQDWLIWAVPSFFEANIRCCQS